MLAGLDAVEEAGGVSLQVLQADGLHGRQEITAGRMRAG